MNILFIHQNFPSQFKYLASALAKRGHKVLAMAISGQNVEGVKLINYPVQRSSANNISPYAADFETKVIRAEACANALNKLKNDGFRPDVIVAHPGWGETLFARNIFPEVRQLHYLEFFYDPFGLDVSFDPEFPSTDLQSANKILAKRAAPLLALDQMDVAISPTYWQASTYPKIYRPKINVVFDGIDTELVRPAKEGENPCLRMKTPQGLIELAKEDQILTFVNRNLEPYRGYHVFMRSLPTILRDNPLLKVLIVGGEGVSYGAKPPHEKTWRDIFLDEVRNQLDLSRIFFLGKIPYKAYLTLLRISSCHLYLTYPFVLSWSCFEAMSSGCIVVGSNTGPVQELINDGVNGLLFDFFDSKNMISKINLVLQNQEKFQKMRSEARKTIVEMYDLKQICLPRQIKIIEAMAL